MAAAVLVPRPRVAALAPPEEAHLSRLLDASARLAPALDTFPPEVVGGALATVFRRFVLEAVLALRAAPDGALRANELARATGLRGQSFANKAKELVALGAATREAGHGAVPAVTYRLTTRGHRLGTLAFGITVFKAAQCRSALGTGGRPPLEVLVDPRAAPSADEERALWRAIDGEGSALAAAFLAGRARPGAAAGPMSPGAVEVRRYAETCVRKWHASVMSILSQGPMRFNDLQAATGAGDEALSRALRSLVAMGSIRKEGQLYHITAWGKADMALGALVLLSMLRPAEAPPAS